MLYFSISIDKSALVGDPYIIPEKGMIFSPVPTKKQYQFTLNNLLLADVFLSVYYVM